MLCRGGPAGLGSCLTAWLECLLHLGQMLFGKLLEAGSLPLCRPPELYSMRAYFPVQAGLSVQCSEGAPFCTCNSLSFLLSSPWIRAVIPSVQIGFSISHPLPTGMPYRGAPPTCVRSSHQATYCNLSSCGGAWPILPRLRSLCCFCDRVRAVFRGCVTHLPLLGRLSTQTKQVAPKRRIGGSGMPATCKVAVLSRQADLWELLDMAQDLITPFFLSLMLLGFCSIMSLLALKADGRSSPLGTLCRSPFDWAPVHVALAFGGFSPRLQVSCLDWHPCNLSSREKRLQRKKGQLSKSRAASGCGQKGYRPTWFGLPQRYYSPLFRVIPVFIISASQLQAVSAMTAPYGNYDVEPPDDFPDAPSMHEPTFSGRNQVHLPWLNVANAESPHVRELPTAAPAVLDDDRERWLGVYVHTPFFPTVSFAIQLSPEAKAYGIIDAIQDHVGGVPHELYPVIVPILPQRYPGYASFVRMPRVIRDAGGADATAIIIDLTRIGGNYFAEVVPRRLSYAQLMLKIKPGATNHSGDFHVFFGRNQTPWLAGEFVTMYDGAVVTVATSVDAPVHCGSFEDLIANEAEWGPISRMPTDVTIRGSLVQHQGKSFFLPAEQTAQNGISQTVCACLDEDIHEVTTCDFPFHDLTFKGFVCDKIFCVFNLPWPGTDRLQGQRRDIFTLCDARAVGVLPSVLHTCHPVIHLPSLAARMRIHLPVAMRLDAVGGRRAFDEVFIDENAALVLFASHLSSASEEAPEEEVASSDIMQADDDEPPSPRSPAAPWDRRGDDVPEAWRRRPTIFTPEARRIAEASFDSVLADNEGYETGILGVALFAPHYQAEFIAIHCKPGEAVNEVIARTRQAAERIPVAHLECSAVVEPLPFEGYATVMVFSRVHDCNDHAAVLVDLSAAGGKRFAATLPTELSHSAWERYVKSMISVPFHACCTFVGCATDPVAPSSPLRLHHGDLVAMQEWEFLERRCETHTQLLADRWEWKDTDRLPRPDKSSGVCMLTAEDRWFLHIKKFPGCTLLQAAEQSLGATPGSLTLGSARFAPIEDLCLQGEYCRGVLLACHTPPPVSVPPAEQLRDDTFIFLDFRQVGCRPYGMYQVGRCWFIPSLLGRFPFDVPTGYTLGIEGGRQDKDYLFANSGTTLRIRLIFVGAQPVSPSPLPPSSADGHEDGGPEPDLPGGGPASEVSSSAPRRDTNRSRSPRRADDSGGPMTRLALRALDNKLAVRIGTKLWVKQGARDLHALHFPTVACFSAISSHFSYGVQANKALSQTLPLTGCKLLCEPTPSSAADRGNLAILRFLAPRLGRPWRYLMPYGAEEILDASPEVSSDEGEVTPVDKTIHFAIAKPGYSLERVSVTVTLPAVIDEVIDMVQAARQEAYLIFFPYLLNVRPQPCKGSGFLIACPIWKPDILYICIDTSNIDGRIFAAECPAYIGRQQLIALADLPDRVDFLVHVADDDTPIGDDTRIHTFAGLRVCFLSPDAQFLYQPALGTTLLDASWWSPRDTVPYPGDGDAYCLVGSRETVLCMQRSLSPLTFRQHIASCVGIDEGRLRLFPSKPRIQDAVVNGLPCTTVVAFEENARGYDARLQAILLDARPIGQGWRLLYASLDDIAGTCLEDIFRDIPRGWFLRVCRACPQLTSQPLRSGHVLTVFSASAPGTGATEGVPRVDAASPAQPHDGPASPEQGDARNASGEEAPRGSGHADTTNAVADHAEAEVSTQYFIATFIIFGQNYAPELIEVRLPQGIEVTDALSLVAAARSLDDSALLPRLVVVDPQPYATHAILIAAPAWRPDGAMVLIDCYAFDGRTFTLQLPSYLTRSDILTASGIADIYEALVFVRGQPWPLPNGVRIDVVDGDLITVAPGMLRGGPLASLGAMLQSCEGWSTEIILPGVAGERAWIISQEDSFHLEVLPARREFVRSDVAERLGITVNELVLRPARPDIRDHAERGRVANNVLAAFCTENSRHHSTFQDTVCFVDARAVMLRVEAHVCQGGTFDVATLRSRHQARCPQFFQVMLWLADVLIPHSSDTIRVQNGTVITVKYWPALQDNLPGFDNADDSDDISGHAGRHAGNRDQQPDAPGRNSDPSVSGTGYRHDAGTGSHIGSTGESALSLHTNIKNQIQPICADGWDLANPSNHLPVPLARSAGAAQARSRSPRIKRCHRWFFLYIFGSCQHGVTGMWFQPMSSGGPVSSNALKYEPSRHPQLGGRPIPTPCRAPIVRPVPSCHHNQATPPVGDSSTPMRTHTVLLPGHPAPPVPRPRGKEDMIRHWPAGLSLPESRPDVEDVLGADFDKPLSFGDTPLGFTPRQLHLLFRPAFRTISLAQGIKTFPAKAAKALAEFTAVDAQCFPAGKVCYTDGSFIPADGTETAKCGWACIFVDRQARTVDMISGTIPQWCEGEDTVLSAFRAECWALVVALWIGTAVWQGQAFTVLSDCQAALAIAEGKVAIHTDGVAHILGHVAGCCREVASVEPNLEYAPGHQGILGNEIADVAAKAAAIGFPAGGILWKADEAPFWWRQHGVLWSWAGIVCKWAKGDDALPSPMGHALDEGRHTGGLHSDDLVRPFMPAGEHISTDVYQGRLRLRIASYNALSLAADKKSARDEGLAFQPAKPALLANQLDNAGIDFAAVQEARTEEGTLNTGSFIRFCSGAVKGHLGVELWFRKNHKLIIFQDDKRAAVVFDPSAFVILFKDPRRLGLLFKQGDCQIVFAGFHAPHRGHTPEELQQWWSQTEAILYRAARGKLLVVGADCNASVGSVVSSHIDHEGAEEQDLPGELLHSLAQKCELWLPATFCFIQRGPTWTFSQRRNGALIRPDYVLLPFSWQQGDIRTWTDASITAGNLVLDHVATIADVTLHTACKTKSRTNPRAQIDVAAVVNPANKARLESVLRDAPRPSWSTNAHAHVAVVTKYLQEALSEAFPRNARRPQHKYLSATAWELQQHVAWLRRKITNIKTTVRQQTLHAVFGAWRKPPQLPAESSAWLRDAQVAEALYGFRLGFMAKALRLRCKKDRAAYLEGLADSIEANRPDAPKAVQSLLARKRRKPFSPEVLPAIKNAQGDTCNSPEDAIARWREHFSALEDGRAVSVAQLIEHTTLLKQSSWPAPESLAVMPSPLDLRNAILAAKRGKACGPDALPGELGLACAQAMQDILFPLTLKFGLLGEEGLGHKGGSLTWLWKGKAAQNECSSYRGILLLSNLGKALHRAFRPQIQQHYEKHASDMQLGGRRGSSVVFGSHAMRSFLRWRAGEGLSTAVLFADVSSAYYSTIRSLAADFPCVGSVVRGDVDDHQVGTELSIAHQLQQPSALSADGASKWLQAVTASLNGGTWMCLKGDGTPLATNKGTRPGSAWADLTFAVVIKRVLALRNACRPVDRRFCRLVQVPWDQCRDWSPKGDPTVSIPLDDLVWADDLASCYDVPCAAEAAKGIGSEAGILADAFNSHDLELSFGPRKTAAILSLRGAGARAANRAIFGGRPEVTVLREHAGVVRLPIVDSYRHLGVMQAREGAIRAEIQQRKAAAWVTFREGRTRLFRCRRVSLSRRGILLNSLVMSKLLFGAGAWPPLREVERRTFAGAVFALYRATLGLRVQDDQHVSMATICSLLGLLDYESLLRIEQLRYLKQLVGYAPDAVWALIRQDCPYMELIRGALSWLFVRIRATSNLPDPLAEWQIWCDLIKTRPAIFKGLILRAKGLETCRTTCYAALQALYRTMRAHGEGRSPSPETGSPVAFTEACIPCRKAFVSRAAWACHSSKLHGYRIAASVLAGSHGGKVCLACGKCFSRAARLRRHLLHSADCRKGWGSFQVTPGDTVPNLHDCAPPLTLEGILEACHADIDPAAYNKGLLEALLDLSRPTVDSVWAVVVDFVEPLEILRRTVRLWRTRTDERYAEIAEDVCLMLDPELLCDSFCKPKNSEPVAECFPELPGSIHGTFPFVLSGAVVVMDLEAAPCPAFCYPFIGGAPLAAAKRQTNFVAAACDVVGLFVQQSLSSKVLLRASKRTLASLEPLPTWMHSAGFQITEAGISSPSE